jgi:hypothetical protein
MKVEFDVDEVWNMFSYVVRQVVDSAGLDDDDRAAITRWRSQEMKRGSEEMRVLMQKVNEDIASALKRQEKSLVRRPDWV